MGRYILDLRVNSSFGRVNFQMKRKLLILNDKEANLGRLLITGKISEETYDKLRSEWQEKTLNLSVKIEEMEFYWGTSYTYA